MEHHPIARLAQQTKQACRQGFPLAGRITYLDGVKTQQMKKGTQVFIPGPVRTPGSYSARIRVYNGDTLEIAQELQSRGLNPTVLNMANEEEAGGGFERGARAQEEDLFRRSNYFQSLYRSENYTFFFQRLLGYRIPEKGVIYSPCVQVFRETQRKGYAYCAPYAVDMIACAAYNKRPSNGSWADRYRAQCT